MLCDFKGNSDVTSWGSLVPLQAMIQSMLATGFCVLMALGATDAAHAGSPESDNLPPLIPQPSHVEKLQGEAFALSRDLRIAYFIGDDEGQKNAEMLAELTSKYLQLHVTPVAVATPKAGDIVLEKCESDSKEGPESYRIEITHENIRIKGGSGSGGFYGVVTLWEILASAASGTQKSLYPLIVEDKPRFPWRGLMLDSARHMQSVSYIENLLDWMALHKFNRFHWHLTDDQGWRIEIPGYPRLTSVGAWRPAVGVDASGDHVRDQGGTKQYGGFYSRKEIAEVVDYAQKRHIIVVPEIEMPGHATAAIAAYPELGIQEYRVNAPSPDWGILPNIFNANDAAVAEINAILDQVIDLFPGPYIHIGGDEVDLYQWRHSKSVEDVIERRYQKNEERYLAKFMRDVATHIASRGRHAVSWDDVPKDGIVKDALIMSWRGNQGAISAAENGVGAIMAIAPTYYLDNREVNSVDEPPGWTDLISLKDIYNKDPVPAELSDESAKYIKGVEALVWTERARKEKWVTSLFFPRATAMAEVAWSAQADRDFPDFIRRLTAFKSVYKLLGIEPGGSMGSEKDGRADFNRTTSIDLDFCDVGATGLVIEGVSSENDSPDLFKVNINRPCWIKRKASMKAGSHMAIALAQVPFNYSVNASAPKVKLPPSSIGSGAMEVRLDRLDGPVLTVIPLIDLAIGQPARRTDLHLPPIDGEHDVYFILTGPDLVPNDEKLMPLTVIDWVESFSDQDNKSACDQKSDEAVSQVKYRG